MPFDAGGFEPVNATEEDLLNASRAGDTDRFLSILLLAKVLVPGDWTDPDNWPTEEIDGTRCLITFTSPERYAERQDAGTDGTDASDERAKPPGAIVRFTSLIAQWPNDEIGFAVNPGSPVSATLSGQEVRTLAGWAVEVGLIGQPELEPEPATPVSEPVASRPPPPTPAPNEPLLMQKTIAADQLPLYLERGYDRVSGFVHRASELGHLRTPEALYRALGLSYSGSPFTPGDAEVYVLRWAAYRPSLYRIPFGGQTEAGMHAMQGWVIERAPFRGNGFAPSETSDVIAEFKVDSVRLPHSAQLWRITREGTETLIAIFDADGPSWRKIGQD